MDSLAGVIDWILRGVGILTLVLGLIKVLLHFFRNDSLYDSIKIIGNPKEEELEHYRCIEEYVDQETNGEYTLITSMTHELRRIKIYKLYLNEKGNLKKGKQLYYLKTLKPMNALLVDIYCNCGIPNRMITWETSNKFKAKYYFSENGQNGNRNMKIIEYEKTFSSILSQLFS